MRKVLLAVLVLVALVAISGVTSAQTRGGVIDPFRSTSKI